MTEKLRIVPMRGWITYHEGVGSSSACAIGNDRGEVVAMAVTHGAGWDPPSASPMARRMVACYNACTGIPTKQLESDFAQGYEPWGDVQHLRARRDELLAALQGLDEAYCRAGAPLTREERHQDRKRLIAAREAIAKALGAA